MRRIRILTPPEEVRQSSMSPRLFSPIISGAFGYVKEHFIGQAAVSVQLMTGIMLHSVAVPSREWVCDVDSSTSTGGLDIPPIGSLVFVLFPYGISNTAGAMILGQHIPNFRAVALKSVPAFGLLPARMIFPHFDRWKVARAAMLNPLRRRLKADEYALGVDEETALVGRLDSPEWRVLGRQTVSVITKAGVRVYGSGEQVVLPAG